MPAEHLMPHARRALSLAASITAAAAVGAVAPAAHAADAAAVARLERIAYNRLGPDALGCAVAKAIVRDLEAIRPDTCTPAKISFGQENAAWAAAQQRRFGADRVTLRLVQPGDRIPA